MRELVAQGARQREVGRTISSPILCSRCSTRLALATNGGRRKLVVPHDFVTGNRQTVAAVQATLADASRRFGDSGVIDWGQCRQAGAISSLPTRCGAPYNSRIERGFSSNGNRRCSLALACNGLRQPASAH